MAVIHAWWMILVEQAAILLLSDRKQLINYAYQLKNLSKCDKFHIYNSLIDNQKGDVHKGCQISRNTDGYSVLAMFTLTRPVWNNIIRPGNVILIIMHLQVLILEAALIKEYLSPQSRSYVAVWQFTMSFIFTFAERHIRWPSTKMAKEREGLKVSVSDCTWIMMPFYMLVVCPSQGNYLNNVYILFWRGLWHIVPWLMTRKALRLKWGF